MFCLSCGKHIRGLVNKVRHEMASEDKKLDYNCSKFQEIPIQKAMRFLNQSHKTRDSRNMTYREYLLKYQPKPFIKINNRNHGEKSNGSDTYARCRGHSDVSSSKRHNKNDRASRKRARKAV